MLQPLILRMLALAFCLFLDPQTIPPRPGSVQHPLGRAPGMLPDLRRDSDIKGYEILPRSRRAEARNWQRRPWERLMAQCLGPES